MPTMTGMPAFSASSFEQAELFGESGSSLKPTPIHTFMVSRDRIECLRVLSSILHRLNASPTIVGDSKVIGSLRQPDGNHKTLIEISVERLSLNRSSVRFSNLTPLSTVEQWSVARHCLVNVRSGLLAT